MKIETGQGVVFLLRNTKGVASYGSATVRGLTGQGVSLADVQAPERLTHVKPTWVFSPNIVTTTQTPFEALNLAAALNRLNLDERDRIAGLKAHFEWKRQHEIHMATADDIDELHTEEKEEAR